MYGICNLSVIPVRKEYSDSSEMTTQLLFGEHFQITDSHKQWKKIKAAYDGYEGWIDEKQYASISPEEFQKLNTSSSYVVTAGLAEVLSASEKLFPVVIGSTLPSYDRDHYCYIANMRYHYDGPVFRSTDPVQKKQLTENALMFLNAPYLWGGKTPFGIDCSGLTQLACKLSGIRIKRDASQQAEQGHTLGMLDEAEPGDLLFFDNEEGRITHAGILLPGHTIIHASGRVRIDRIDYHGIFNETLKKYTHRLRLIKRII